MSTDIVAPVSEETWKRAETIMKYWRKAPKAVLAIAQEILSPKRPLSQARAIQERFRELRPLLPASPYTAEEIAEAELWAYLDHCIITFSVEGTDLAVEAEVDAQIDFYRYTDPRIEE